MLLASLKIHVLPADWRSGRRIPNAVAVGWLA